MAWLLGFFLLLPLVELWVMVEVAGQIGVALTILALIAVSFIGGWVVKRQGVGVWGRLRRQLDRGQLPQTEALDGVLLLAAGLLLLVPGFISDIVAVLLLLPPTRAMFRRMLLGWVRRRPISQRLVIIGNGRTWTGGRGVIDVESEEETVDRPGNRPMGELGRP
jgi:UPF0716 protein FxsA